MLLRNAVAASVASGMPLQAKRPSTQSPRTEHFDVIVAGAGPAGIIGATQAGRCGVKTLLIEKNSIVGGTAISAHVNFPGLFHAWGKQIISGIGWELIEKVITESGQKLPDFQRDVGNKHWQHQIRIDKFIFSTLAEEMILKSGCQLLLHTISGKVDQSDSGWELTICGKEGLRNLTAKVLVDCTGDANLVSLAGFETVRPNESQPGAVIFRLAGYDAKSIDCDKIQLAFEHAENKGLIKWSDIGGKRANAIEIFLCRSFGENRNHIDDILADSSPNRTDAELKGRQSLMRIYQFFKKQPGLENIRFEFFSYECGIRQTLAIVGEETITAQDYTSGRVWPDALCYSFYPIDMHRSGGRTIDIRPLSAGTVATIPRGAMIPQNSKNLLVAGRCISGDSAASSAYRVQASCMAMGQAAGAMAALAVLKNSHVRELDIELIRSTLRQHNAIVPA